MKSAGITKPLKMLSCPTAAFLLWMPFHNSYADEKVLALGQLSFTATTERDSHLTAFGSLFNTNSLPRYELSKHLPFGKKGSLKILEALLPSCVVGNLFLPGNLTDIELTLNQDDQLKVSGKIRPEAEIAFKETKQILSNSFLRLGAIVVPSSFKVAPVGSDIHYSGSFPMNKKPVRGQTTSDGEVFGAKGLHIIDAACLPRLYSKPHTLTMMANADRISRSLLKKLLNGC
jgi:choline dehydrogenase-like flavoprotein